MAHSLFTSVGAQLRALLPRTPASNESAARAASPKAAPVTRRSVARIIQDIGANSLTQELDLSRATDLTPRKLDILLEAMTRLRVLILRETGLTFLPSSIGELKHLAHLDVSRNKLRALPAELRQCGHLTHLSASYNELTRDGLPLGSLRSLRHLEVGHNKLRQLSDDIWGLADLRVLRVSHNELVELPKGLGLLPRLQLLNASHNQLVGLPESLARALSLRSLFVQHNRLTELPEELGYLPRFINLDVTGNAIEALNPGLRQNDHLRVLGVLTLSQSQTQVGAIRRAFEQTDVSLVAERVETLRPHAAGAQKKPGRGPAT